MKKLLFIMLLIAFNINAQKQELGKVTVEELKEKVHPRDTSAVAAVLFEKGKTYFDYTQQDGFVLITEVEVKIKIYKKEGLDWANKEVKYYIGGETDELVNFSKAVTYNLVNNQIEKAKLKSDGEFDQKENKFWGVKKISMPGVKEGSIIEYRYTIKSPFFQTLPDWSFQNFIPVNYSEYKTLIPEYFTYNVYRKGFLTPVETKNTVSRSVDFINKVTTAGQTSYGHSVDKFTYTEYQVTYKLENVPALKEESFVNNIGNYVTTVEHERSSTQYPQQAVKYYSSSWEDVTKTIYDNEDFGNQLNKDNYFENDVNALLAGLTTRDEKIGAIFNHVKTQMNWNGYYGYRCDDGVRKAYKDKKGNAAEINLMLTAMLRFAGINASPVLVSTRQNGIPVFPSITAFNYVITGVEAEGSLMLLDATDKFAYPNILPKRDLNWFGRIIRKDGTSEQIDLMPKTNSKDAIILMAEIDPQGKVTGKIRDQYFDYNAYLYRQEFNSVNKDSRIEKIEKKHHGLEIGDYETQNDADLSKPIVENYSFTHANSVEIIGDKMYFSPLLFLGWDENPFKQEVREYPVDFIYPNQDKYTINIKIPEGYTVESLPAKVNMEMEGKETGFKYSISNNGQQIQGLIVFDINQSIIGSEQYTSLKSFFKAMIEKENEKIVLKKI